MGKQRSAAPNSQHGRAHNRSTTPSWWVASAGPAVGSVCLALLIAAWRQQRDLSPGAQLHVPGDLPVLFLDLPTYENLRRNPEALRPSSGVDKGELLNHDLVDAVVRTVDLSDYDSTQLRRRKCTIRRLVEPLENFAAFLRVNGTHPAIFSSGTGVMRDLKVSPEDIARAIAPVESFQSCLCNPLLGTNFHDGTLPPGIVPQTRRYCLWAYKMLPRYLFSRQGNISNQALADRMRFQCRVSAARHISPLLKLVMGPLVQGSHHETSAFWQSTPDPETFLFWFASPDTRTPLHQDEYQQLLLMLHGSKYVVTVSDTSTKLVRRAWENGGPVNITQYDPAAIQECVLHPGEMLWLPDNYGHDVYSLDPSFMLTIRYPPVTRS